MYVVLCQRKQLNISCGEAILNVVEKTLVFRNSLPFKNRSFDRFTIVHASLGRTSIGAKAVRA